MLFLGLVPHSSALPSFKGDRWDELNIGPFYVDSQGDLAAAREDLTQLEQLRWVLGGLLESKDLPSLWPIRIILDKNAKTNPPGEFIWQNGEYLLVCSPGAHIPLDQVAGLLLDANTPRIPPEAESGLRRLFSTLEAHGSRVIWGGPVPHPDLAYARMQLFATKFEYGLSFHIFVSALKSGSDLRVAERNAFGKDPQVLEKEAAAKLASADFQSASVSGRPLDPKRDFGEHSLDAAVIQTYLADAELMTDPKAAEAAFKAAVEAGGDGLALGYEGLAALAERDKRDPANYLEDAMRAGSKSAPVYVEAAKQKNDADALKLLKRASDLNPKWAEPFYREAELTDNPLEKEALLKKATQLEPRQTQYWIELAQTQTNDGHALAAQGSWLRAEDSSATEAERNRIHELRISSEQERLDAAEAERRREREAAHLENQRAEDAEAARIRAAEEKANRALDTESGMAKPTQTLPWNDVVPKRTLTGTLLKTECLKGVDRLSIKDTTGKTLQLLLRDPDSSTLSCGIQQPPPRVSISYAAEAEDQFHTAGRILTIRIQ